MTVATFNVNYGMAGDPATLQAITEPKADIVLLQESTPAWEANIRAAHGDTYPFMEFRHSNGAGGLAVLSKVSFAEQSYVQSEAGWFPAWRLLFDTPLGKVQVLNVHLRPPISEGGSVVSGYFTTPDIRVREIEQHFAALDSDVPTLIVGDFNENRRGSAIGYLARRHLHSVLSEFEDEPSTWRWSTPLGTVTEELDHIVYGPELVAHDARTLEVGNSDHLPVVATFSAATDP